MVNLAKGGNAPLGSTTRQVSVACRDRSANAEKLDVSCFLLTDVKKVRNNDDMILDGQRQAKDGSVRIKNPAISESAGRRTALVADLSKVTSDVTSIAIVGTTAAGPVNGLEQLSVAAESSSGDPIVFDITTNDASEAALILGGLYPRIDQWNFRAVAHGFNGGPGPIAQHCGVVTDEPAAAAPPTAPAPSVNSGGLKFSREVKYFQAHPQMSEHYRYPPKWRTGSK